MNGKKQLLEQGANLFEKNDNSKQIAASEAKRKQEKLFEKIGDST